MTFDWEDVDMSCSAPVVCETPFGLMLTTVEKVLSENLAKSSKLPATSSIIRINPFLDHASPATSGGKEVSEHSFRQSSCSVRTVSQSPRPGIHAMEKCSMTGSVVNGDDSKVLNPSPRPQRISFLCPVVSEFISKKHSRTKVFSGAKSLNPKTIGSLLEISTNVVQNNAENLVGYDKLTPSDLLNLLKTVSVEQLRKIENNNPEICSKTNEIWKIHYNQEFRSLIDINQNNSWRETYETAVENRRRNIQSITKRSRRVEKPKHAMAPAKLVLDDQGFMDTFERAFDNNIGVKRRGVGIKRRLPNPDY